MTQAELDILNTTQQVLRLTVLSLAAACKADRAVLGHLLELASVDGSIDLSPMAREMLSDLASGVTGISSAGLGKN